jgi:hypothetical protein
MIEQAKTLIIAVLATALIFGSAGFASGWYFKGKSIAASELKEVITARRVDAKEAERSVIVSAIVDSAVEKSFSNIEQIKRKARKHDPVTPEVCSIAPISSSDERPVLGGDPNLDPDTVRLLNAAREDRPVDPAGGLDAKESQAPVSVSEFVDNDLEVVRLYHDLATRHDALVNWVADLVKRHGELIVRGR